MAMNPRLLRPLVSGDPDAMRYIAAVQNADGSALEPAIKQAIIDFVTGCKSDGIWDAIKASCILAGARTLAGALVPLVGTAPTNNNFVSGDYDRATGLAGNGSDKYLDTNRANNADPQDSQHLATYVGGVPTATVRSYMGAGGNAAGRSAFGIYFATLFAASRVSSAFTTGGAVTTGFCGISRSASANYILRNGASDQTVSATSQTPTSGNIFVLAREDDSGGATTVTDARLAFYSIGESLDLASLDNRVSNLITAIGAAI